MSFAKVSSSSFFAMLSSKNERFPAIIILYEIEIGWEKFQAEIIAIRKLKRPGGGVVGMSEFSFYFPDYIN